jgi:arsenite methyltransferase
MSNTQSRSLPIQQASCCGSSSAQRFQIRSARGEDLAQVQELLRAADLPLEGLQDQFGEGYAVAQERGKLLGAIGIERYGRYGLLRSAVVAASERGRGIGEALVLDRIDWSIRAGLDALYLLTTTASDYFPRFGFAVADRTAVPDEIQASPEFASICPSSSKVMRLPLAGGEGIRALVRRNYSAAAERAAQGDTAGCGCGAEAEQWDPITSNLYDAAERSGVPAKAFLASLGCGNPTALAELKPGEVVLDLGSGGGIDVLLSAKRVGPAGFAYGLDMTDAMLELARENQRAAGATNVEFRKGEIENIPLPDNTVDVIISNCVINLSADKSRVLREAFRVLKPGGRFAVSDVVVRGEVPAEVRHSMELWVGCVAGALSEDEYRSLLADAGFQQIELEPTRVYRADDARAFLEAGNLDDALLQRIDGRIVSAFVRAVKPA